MIRTAQILPNLTVIDTVNLLYGKLDLMYQFITDNPFIESVDTDLTPFIGRSVVYDDTLSDFDPPQLNIDPPQPASTTGTVIGVYGQSIYDICLMTYGSLDFMYRLLTDNKIDGINSPEVTGVEFSFDTTKISNSAMFNHNVITSTVYATLETLQRRRPFGQVDIPGHAFDFSFDLSFDA